MRPAPSLMLSLLLFAAIVGSQIFALWPERASESVPFAQTMQLTQAGEFGVDVLEEFEDEVEWDSAEFTIHRSLRMPEVNMAQDDRFELFGPPEQLAVGVEYVWVPPQAHVVELQNPWPRSMLRPPSFSLPTAGTSHNV